MRRTALCLVARCRPFNRCGHRSPSCTPRRLMLTLPRLPLTSARTKAKSCLDLENMIYGEAQTLYFDPNSFDWKIAVAGTNCANVLVDIAPFGLGYNAVKVLVFSGDGANAAARRDRRAGTRGRRRDLYAVPGALQQLKLARWVGARGPAGKEVRRNGEALAAGSLAPAQIRFVPHHPPRQTAFPSPNPTYPSAACGMSRATAVFSF